MSPKNVVLLRTHHKGKVKEYLATLSEAPFHTEFGVIDLSVLLENENLETVTSHMGQKFSVVTPRSPDFFRHSKRTGTPMIPKDIGLIMAHTGICSSDTVLEAGTGSGSLTIYLGFVAKRVLSYEIREEFVRVAQNNVAKAGLSNVEIRCGDLVETLPLISEEFDVIILDMGGSEKAVCGCFEKLKNGGFLVTYSPFLEQATKIREEIEKLDFFDCRTFECFEREISFSSRGTRPSTIPVGHTGYLTFARK
ncbi:methyltransferase domain-containing protein [Methanohalophilus sp.]|uniref:tRNA (adenine-N1)-methyltransferase n=1 Tax=Methanohalophilus sp. TaxID=1966352 RepID=UPI00260B7161|nr:methyltransferase domain-containing protein [Methanohalophilus sp.]MDK2891623.1 tRNA (adenine57-N1/adenine58-N1)-methyltransferase catalytic subunit [Methanohalophilus sp.]